jgi:hypothetical protein
MSRERPPSTAPADHPNRMARGPARTGEQNAEPLSESQAFTDRWWLAAPGDDESLRSLVERADRLYGKPPQEGYAWQSQPYREGSPLDVPTSRELVRLARMLGISPRHLHSHRLEDGPHLLELSERRAYCPRCLHEDRATGRPRTFRRAWARVLVVSCTEHGTPLHWAEPRLAAEVNFALEPSPADLTEEDWEVVRLIDVFAHTLEACLWGDALWPAEWHGNPQAARALLIRCLCNLSWQHASPPVAHLWVRSSLTPVISFPPRRMPPLYGVPWDAVRRVGRPAWRRAALWLVAAQVIPGISTRCLPETIPTAYLEATDQWWDDFPPSPHTQKLRHVHASLRRLCAPFPVNRMGR